MKAFFKPLLFAILVIAGLRGIAQCTYPNYSYSIGTGGNVTFTDYSFDTDTANGGNSQQISYIWNFGDGSATLLDSSYQVTHTYTTSGTFTVSLEIVSTGCDSTLSQAMNINLCQGGSYYTEANTGFGAYTFTPYNLSSLPGSTVMWNFADGTTSTSATPSHQYTSGGGYEVSLIVTDPSLSCADTTVNYLGVILCSYPLNIDTTVLSYNPVDIQFQPTPQNAGYTYNWTFGDGGTGAGETITHNYYAGGNFTTTLTVSDATTGCSYAVNTSFNLDLCGLNAGFGNTGNGSIQSFFAYNYDSINGTGNISNYAWTFPGATPSTGSGSEVNNIVYPSIGTYSACVYLTTTGGCIDTICNTFNITAPVYSITGMASKPDGGFAGTVYLIVQDSIGKLALVDSVVSYYDTANSGSGYNYYFYNLPADTYYVKAALSTNDPDYANYLPTYYNGVLTWGTATPVIITNTSATADIDLIAGTNPGGPGFVSGYVSQGAGLVLGGSDNEAKSLGGPLQGVQINLLTSNNEPVAYTYTDANGHYQFANLAYNSYQIYAEQLNKIPNPIDFTLNAENPTDSGANISINSRTATGISSISNMGFTNVYPNPVTNTVQLVIGCTQDINATLKLVDVLGRTVMSQQLNLVGGQNTMQVNMETMTAGVYQLIIENGTGHITYKLVKAN